MNQLPSANPQTIYTPANFPIIEDPNNPDICWPDANFIVTEDDTPKDSIFSEKQQRLLTGTLYSSWSPDRPFVAMANVGLFQTPVNPLVPDVLLSMDVSLPDEVWTKGHRCYFMWIYGKTPEIVIEVVSNRAGNEDTDKLRAYARIRVPYYVIYDPQQNLSEELLRIYKLDNGPVYQQIDSNLFPCVGLGLTLWEGTYEDLPARWLRWCDLSGQMIPTAAERADNAEERADNAEKRADNAEERADNAEKRALRLAEKLRALRLAEKLRALGIDPNGWDPDA